MSPGTEAISMSEREVLKMTRLGDLAEADVFIEVAIEADRAGNFIDVDTVHVASHIHVAA